MLRGASIILALANVGAMAIFAFLLLSFIWVVPALFAVAFYGWAIFPYLLIGVVAAPMNAGFVLEEEPTGPSVFFHLVNVACALVWLLVCLYLVRRVEGDMLWMIKLGWMLLPGLAVTLAYGLVLIRMKRRASTLSNAL